jgi:hypothetical protein
MIRVELIATNNRCFLPFEFVIDIHDFLNLRRSVAKHVQIRIGHAPVHISRVGKQVLRRPQQLDARLVLLLQHVIRNGIQVLMRLVNGGTFWRHIDVVKAIIVDTEFGKEFKGHIDASQGQVHALQIALPVTNVGGTAKGVGSAAAHKGMPEADTESQPFSHGFAQNDFFGVVVFETQRIFRVGALVFDFGDRGKEFGVGHDDGCDGMVRCSCYETEDKGRCLNLKSGSARNSLRSVDPGIVAKLK